jgi:hypothetical protein
VCLVPDTNGKDTGLFFVANESTKMFTYFVPELGHAPKWYGVPVGFLAGFSSWEMLGEAPKDERLSREC